MTVFTKGGKVQTIPIVDTAFWNELERHILDWGSATERVPAVAADRAAQPAQAGEKSVTEYRDEPMGVHGLHKWCYACLERASDIYPDWDIDQLAETLRGMLAEGER